MFSLIISIIAIALVIVLAGAALYYGGEGFNEGTVRAEVAKYKNEAAQIAGALVAYQVENRGFVDHPADGNGSFGWEDLVAGQYLKTLPSSTTNAANELEMRWGVREQLIILPGVSDEVCLEANRVAGIPTNDEAAILAYDASISAVSNVGNGFAPTCDVSLDPSIPCCFDPNTVVTP